MSDSSSIVIPADQPSPRDENHPRPRRVIRLKAGLAIGFGLPFALGIAYQLCALFGWSVDWSGLRLMVELGALGGLVALTLGFERLPLGSLGVHKLRFQEIYFGLAAGLTLLVVSAAAAEVLRPRGAGSGGLASLVSAMAPADSTRLSQAPIWLALLVLVASALAEELAARGYAIRRLRVITGSTALAAAAALAIDMVARIPLWGLRYALTVAPAEMVLVALYLWRRQLVTCIVAHLTLTLTIFLAIHFVGPGTMRKNQTVDESANVHLDEEAGVADLRRALGDPTGPGAAEVKQAQKDFMKGDYVAALQHINDAIRVAPKNRDHIGFRASIHAALGDTGGVISDYTEMLALNPKDADTYRLRARAYKVMRDYKSAADDLENAIKRAPKDARNYEERASLYFWQQQYPAAIEDFNTAISLDPDNRQYVLERAYFYQHINQTADALKDCDQLVSSDPKKPDGYECRVNVYLALGDEKAALVNLDAAVQRDPDNPKLYSMRGKAEMDTGLLRQAHADFEKIASLEPDDPRICDGIAWALATSAHDEVRDGKAALALATHENEVTGYSHWKYLETLAAAYAETGDTVAAVKWQKAALMASDATDPDDIEWMRGLLRAFQAGRAWRETATTAYGSRPRLAVMIGVIAVFALAVVGLAALVLGSARWSIRRAKRTPVSV